MKSKMEFSSLLKFATTANFKRNVIKSLPEGVNKIFLLSVGMKRLGTGSYNFFADVEINDIKITLKIFTNSSPDWDFYKDLEVGTRAYDNWAKQTTLMLLEGSNDRIIELIY